MSWTRLTALVTVWELPRLPSLIRQLQVSVGANGKLGFPSAGIGISNRPKLTSLSARSHPCLIGAVEHRHGRLLACYT